MMVKFKKENHNIVLKNIKNMRSISSVKLFYTQTYGKKFDSEIAVRGIVALTAKFSC